MRRAGEGVCASPSSMTYQTLRLYCNQGLIPSVKRNNYRKQAFYDNALAGRGKYVSNLLPDYQRSRHATETQVGQSYPLCS